MSEDHVTRPEFDIYVKMTAESMALIAKSTEESLVESRETNQILREHTIHNDNKHEVTNVRISAQEARTDQIEKIVLEREGVYQAANKLKWAIGIILAGVLAAGGTWIFQTIVDKEKTEVKISK